MTLSNRTEPQLTTLVSRVLIRNKLSLMKVSRKILPFWWLILIAMEPINGYAQLYWQTENIIPNTVYSLIKLRSGTLFAGTTAGIFRSFDHGQHWRSCGFDKQSVSPICVDSNDHIVICSYGFWVSTDEGSSWNKSDLGVYVYGNSLAADRYGNIFAAGGYSHDEIWKSVDGGFHWNQVSSPPGGGGDDFLSLCVDTSGILYKANDCYPNIYTSSDHGVTWISHIYDHNWGSCEWGITCMYLGPDQHLLVADSKGGVTLGRLMRTTDHGETWVKLCDSLGLTAAIIADDDASAILIANTCQYRGSLTKTYDGAVSWMPDSTLPCWPRGWSPAATLVRDSGQALHFGIQKKGLWDSYDFGRTWALHNSGLNSITALCVSEDVADSSILMGTSNGIYKSTDGGHLWRLFDTLLEGRSLTSLAVLGHRSYLVTCNDSILKLTDGSEWKTSLAFLGPNAKIKWDSTSSILYGYNDLGILEISYDSGMTWVDRGRAIDPGDSVSDFQCSGQVCIATKHGAVWESLDSAQHWIDIGHLGKRINSVASKWPQTRVATDSGIWILDTTSFRWYLDSSISTQPIRWTAYYTPGITLTISGKGQLYSEFDSTGGSHSFQVDLPSFSDIKIFKDGNLRAVTPSTAFYMSYSRAYQYDVATGPNVNPVARVYPNPTHGICNVMCDYLTPLSVAVVDELGRSQPVAFRLVDESRFSFELGSEFSDGIYAIVITDRKGVSTVCRLIKNSTN